ncbi:carboxymuconolactone decarboxylase family protein [Pseudonocardia spinosispora]|uniref:carboxymuconolactone decarboxylase family protein n=1 Tax=Pseudonocardia spinosispora TaxID=103441 RepID=UPI00040B312D|nr:carboxymuconolactone decarboxylase family protein [Pseudonocardia spinosispora]
MARIKGVTPEQSGLGVKLAFFFTRRQLTKLTGRTPERMVEPLEMFAHIPPLLAAYGKLEQATSKLHELDQRTRMLAELKAATLTSCEYCIDLGSQVARNSGLTDDELLALPHYRTSPLFSAVDRLVLEYVAGVSSTPVEVSDELFARLSAHFTEPQLVELTYVVALENLRGRFNLALGVGAAGFSEGMVCAVPEQRR